MEVSFLGKGHTLFALSVCRFQHVDVPLILFHYFSWTVALTAIYAGLLTIGWPVATMMLVVVVAWLFFLDAKAAFIYFIFSVFQLWLASLVAPVSFWFRFLLPVVAVGAIATESRVHVLLQGYAPGPPPIKMPKQDLALFVPYFVFVTGIFWISLDFLCKLTNHRPSLHKAANKLSNSWHILAAENSKNKSKVEYDFHLATIKKQQPEQ
jgi:hypothetical protein